ncbi:MAG: ATP-binding protein [Planctomycetales bacterium]|nr:ATP-binding protein [Planctomycetales bacterium]
MLHRNLEKDISDALQRQAAVAILGPRQVGKTTLALHLGERWDATYLDLENPEDRLRLEHPRLFFEQTQQQLVILDEVHRVPELFATLRGVIDSGRREDLGTGRFLMLGSASIDLLKQAGETLAGRVAYFELTPLLLSEVQTAGYSASDLWLSGGFPGSLLVESERESIAWRRDFIRSYLEREVQLFGGRLPVETLRRLWTMLAHHQGGLLNASDLARSLGVSAQSVNRYIDLLVDLLLIRRLIPFHTNIGKRLIKSPKLYIRDSGLLHVLLGIESMLDLTGHPIIGMSWEGFVIEQLVAALGLAGQVYFYRSAAGAEIDLLIELAGQERWAFEIKRKATSPQKGFYLACDDVSATRRIVVHGGDDCFPLREHVEAMSLAAAIDSIVNGAAQVA